MERRTFLARAAGSVAALVSIVLALPLLASLLGRRGGLSGEGWSEVGPLQGRPSGRPRDMKFRLAEHDAYLERETLRSVWVVPEESGGVTVFSPVCTHLGCHFDWDEATGHFKCPCHASVFSRRGEVLYGPAPRPLDTLEHKVVDGILYVKWRRFEPGVPRKVPV